MSLALLKVAIVIISMNIDETAKLPPDSPQRGAALRQERAAELVTRCGAERVSDRSTDNNIKCHIGVGTGVGGQAGPAQQEEALLRTSDTSLNSVQRWEKMWHGVEMLCNFKYNTVLAKTDQIECLT